jgi:hypothetical protein
MRVNEILAKPWIWPSLKNARAIVVGYCKRFVNVHSPTVAQGNVTDSHLSIIRIRIRRCANSSLNRPGNVSLLRIHLHELQPWLDAVPW